MCKSNENGIPVDLTLLGINVSIDLTEIENLKYELRLQRLKIQSKFEQTKYYPHWKITVIKSLIISKRNHVFPFNT